MLGLAILAGTRRSNVYDAIEQSCDVFFYNVGAPRQPIDESKSDYLHYRDKDVAANTLGEKHYFEGLGIELIKKNLTERFWFGKATGIELPTRGARAWCRRGMAWRAPIQGTGWSVGDTINVSIGQGYLPDDAAPARAEHRGVCQWRQDPQAAARARNV